MGHWASLATATAAFLVAASAAAASPAEPLKITSPAFLPNGPIPAQYTCKGADVSPELRWSGVPANAGSLALIVDDPDAPDPAKPQRTWVHWVVIGLTPATTGIFRGGPLPGGARAGTNDFGKAKWGGPCPPIGTHRYFFKLYALDKTFALAVQAPTKAALETAMKGHVLASAEVIGTFAGK